MRPGATCNYTYLQRVVCLYCSKEMIYKNLKYHTGQKHARKPLKYRVASSKDISEMFGLQKQPESEPHHPTSTINTEETDSEQTNIHTSLQSTFMPRSACNKPEEHLSDLASLNKPTNANLQRLTIMLHQSKTLLL